MNFFKFLISKYFFIQIIITFAILLGIIFGLKHWLEVVTNHDQKIQVPNLYRASLEEVDKLLKDLNLDYIVIDSSAYNPNHPKKSVIEQSPESGDFVKERRKIYLTINPSKYKDVLIPDLYGYTKRQATSHLKALGIKVGENFTYIDDLGKDVVRGIYHNERLLTIGDKLPLNSTIELVLGNGKRK